jgi:hypothetical protein
VVRVESQDFEPQSQEKQLRVPPDADSALCTFLLTPQYPGRLTVHVEIYKDDVFAASRYLHTNGEASDRLPIKSANYQIVSILLPVVGHVESPKSLQEIETDTELLRRQIQEAEAQVRSPVEPPSSRRSRMMSIWPIIALLLLIAVCAAAITGSPALRRVLVNFFATNTPTPTATLTPTPTGSPTPTSIPSFIPKPTPTGRPPPHSTLTGTEIAGEVVITEPVGDCVWVAKQQKIVVSWSQVPSGTDLWVFVYSPEIERYFPFLCAEDLQPSGSRVCILVFMKHEPYEAIVVLANKGSFAALDEARQAGSGALQSELPTGIKEKDNIRVYGPTPTP